MTNTKLTKRITSLLLSLALVMTYLPVSSAASPLAQSLITETAADPGTAHTWETMMGTDADGNRYDIPDNTKLDRTSRKQIDLYLW